MKIAIIGCGNMGKSYARHWAKDREIELLLFDRNKTRGDALATAVGGKAVKNLDEAVTSAELILLAIKPKDLHSLAKKLGGLKGKVVLSILTGATIELLKGLFKGATVIRSMPNIALMSGEGVIALVKDETHEEENRLLAETIHRGMGLVIWTNEKAIDAFIALAGSGPAFILAIIEVMTEAGIEMGLQGELGLELALQTILGAVALCKGPGGHPGQIQHAISSPSGITIAGLKALEKAKVRSGVIQTFDATYHKSRRIL